MVKSKVSVENKSFLANVTEKYMSLTVLGLALIVTDGYYNITETKSIWFLSLSLMLTAAAIFSAVKSLKSKTLPDFRHSLSFTDYAILAFAGFNLLSALMSDYQSDVWFGSASRYQGAAVLLIYAAVYFIVSRNYSLTRGFFGCCVFAFCAVCVLGVLNCFNIDPLGFYEIIGNDYKKLYISTIGNVNFYSSYLCLVFPLAVWCFCLAEKRKSLAVCTLALIAGASGMMVSSSESFVAGFVPAVLLIPLLLPREAAAIKKYTVAVTLMTVTSQAFLLFYRLAPVKNVALSALLEKMTGMWEAVGIILVCTAVYLLVSFKPQLIKICIMIYGVLLLIGAVTLVICFVLANTADLSFMNGMFRITDSWGTYRGEIWKQCIEAYGSLSVREKLFGVGPEALYRLIEALEVHGSRTLDQAHNEYLQFLLTSGVCGLLSYLTVIASLFVTAIRSKSRIARGFLVCLTAYWIQATFNIAQPFTTPLMYIFISCLCTAAVNDRAVRDL